MNGLWSSNVSASMSNSRRENISLLLKFVSTTSARGKKTTLSLSLFKSINQFSFSAFVVCKIDWSSAMFHFILFRPIPEYNATISFPKLRSARKTAIHEAQNHSVWNRKRDCDWIQAVCLWQLCSANWKTSADKCNWTTSASFSYYANLAFYFDFNSIHFESELNKRWYLFFRQ